MRRRSIPGAIHDANANVISQTLDGTTTTYHYDRNRLLSATAGTTTSSYNYDPFGRLNSVTSGGQVIESKKYHGFDHVVEHTKLTDTGGTKTTTYTYDPLERTASKTDASGETTEFNYLGLQFAVFAGYLPASTAGLVWS